MRFVLFLGCAGLLLLPACGNRTPQTPPAGETVAGLYAWGFEVSTFAPCGIDEAWAVFEAPPDLLERYREVAGRDYEPVYCRMIGTKSGLGRYGHMGLCDREWRVAALVEMRAVRPGDCD